MLILPYADKQPEIHETVFLARGTIVSGDVKIGEYSSIWYNTSIRGDVAQTIIGRGVSVEDNCTLHQSPNMPLIIEDDVIVGHNAILHSCVIRRGALIGMGAIILDGAEVGENAMVGAGALVPPGKKIPANSVAVGSPATVVRRLTEPDQAELRRIRQSYREKAQYYKRAEKEF